VDSSLKSERKTLEYLKFKSFLMNTQYISKRLIQSLTIDAAVEDINDMLLLRRRQ